MVDISKELEDIEDNPITSILVGDKAYTKTNIAVLKYFVNERKISGVYITVNKPYQTLVNFFNKNGINTNRIFFIDMITKLSGDQPNRIDNCLFMESPESLTDLSIALTEVIKSIQGDKFIFLDTLSTLLIYHELGTVTKFAHFLTNKMRVWMVKGVIISLIKETKPSLEAELTQFCDKVIDVKEE